MDGCGCEREFLKNSSPPDARASTTERIRRRNQEEEIIDHLLLVHKQHDQFFSGVGKANLSVRDHECQVLDQRLHSGVKGDFVKNSRLHFPLIRQNDNTF